jgi:hypothetical protein
MSNGKQKSSMATRVHQMNHSIYGANRTTHLKIVVIALALVIAVANLAIDLLKNRYRGRDQGGQTDHAMSGPVHLIPRSEAHRATR